MPQLLQQILVAVIVVAAALSAAWRLAGLATRLRLLDALARGGVGVLARWAAAKAAGLRSAGGGCAGCAAGSVAGSAAHKRPAGR
jgi:hypothetical protein